jgi:hypothetical protein
MVLGTVNAVPAPCPESCTSAICMYSLYCPVLAPHSRDLRSDFFHRPSLPKPLTDCIQTEEPPSHHSFMISLTATHSGGYTILPLYRSINQSISKFTAPASPSRSALSQTRVFQLAFNNQPYCRHHQHHNCHPQPPFLPSTRLITNT